MKKILEIKDENAMLQCGEDFAKTSGESAHIYLTGELGAGKTTWVRGFLRGLGYTGRVKSPTYTLVEPYHLSTRTVYHFDLYRLNSPRELENIGIEEYLHDKAICLIEWPERGKGVLPEPDTHIIFHIQANIRKLEITF